MAPPVAPSPHRFLPGARRQNSPTKTAKPSSRLNPSSIAHQEPPPPPPPVAVPITTPQRLSRPTLPPSATQFAPTPRFSLARPKPAAQQQDVPVSPPRSTLAHALRPPRLGEDVEETASSPVEGNQHYHNDDDDEEMLLTTELGEAAHPSIEHGHEHKQEHEHHDQTTELPFSPKRRRLDGDLASPQRTTAANTPAPHSRFAPTTHANTATASTPAPILRPTFLRPPTPPLPAPVPQTFSPHRRGANFIPGGTASTVQAWVIAAGQSAAQNRRQQAAYQYSQNHSEGWGFRVKVDEAEQMDGGGWLISGHRDDQHGERVRCMLVGEGKGEVRAGGLIGVRGLGWEVDINDQGQWWVGVGWDGSGL